MDTKSTLAETQGELRDLLRMREDIDKRIKGLLQILEGLKTMGEVPDPEIKDKLMPLSSLLQANAEDAPGFTDAIRQIIRNADGPLAAIEIRDELEAGGYGGKTPKHTLISVYTVLNRLKKTNKISEIRDKDGKLKFAVSPIQTVMDAMGF